MLGLMAVISVWDDLGPNPRRFRFRCNHVDTSRILAVMLNCIGDELENKNEK